VQYFGVSQFPKALVDGTRQRPTGTDLCPGKIIRRKP
jgi:hypothetical protein